MRDLKHFRARILEEVASPLTPFPPYLQSTHPQTWFSIRALMPFWLLISWTCFHPGLSWPLCGIGHSCVFLFLKALSFSSTKPLALGFPLNSLASPLRLPLGSVSLIHVGVPWGSILIHSCPSSLFPERFFFFLRQIESFHSPQGLSEALN